MSQALWIIGLIVVFLILMGIGIIVDVVLDQVFFSGDDDE